MDPKDLEFEETLADSELLLKNTARSARTGRKRTRAAGGKETAGKGRPPAEKGGGGEKNGG